MFRPIPTPASPATVPDGLPERHGTAPAPLMKVPDWVRLCQFCAKPTPPGETASAQPRRGVVIPLKGRHEA